MDFSSMTIRDLARSFRGGEVSSVEVTESFLAKIKRDNEDNFSFITISEDLALDQARRADERIAKGEENLLLGIPGALKDNIMLKGVRCTAGSRSLGNYRSSYDAHVVKRLKDEGSVILGKTNMDEFAMGSSTESSAFGVTRNPHDPSRVPGGSSGGSAVAVASGLCSFAIGSDTGGSIRQPASFCGVIGLKTTYGSVSRRGLIAMASSLDQIGVFARKIDDATDVFEVISGKDELDSTSADRSFSREKIDVAKLRVGVPKEYFTDGMDKRIEAKIRESIDSMAQMGIEVKEIDLPHTDYALPVYYIIMPSEVSSNMGRYDGLRYGLSDDEAGDMVGSYFANRGKGFGPEVKRRIVLGTYALSAGYKDAYYQKALKVRSLIKDDFTKAFNDVDMIVTPTCPTLPFKVGEKTEDPLSMYLSDIFTVTANLAGVPALSMPCGKIDGLPVGIQMIGRPFEENTILEAGKAFEELWNIK